MLAALLLVAVCELLEWPFLQRPLERVLSQGLARELDLGSDFGLRLIGSVRARTDVLVVGTASRAGEAAAGEDSDAVVVEGAVEGGAAAPFARAEGLRLVLPYATVLALWRGDPEAKWVVRSLEVDRVVASLRREADGTVNWAFGQKRERNPKRPARLPEFQHLLVRSGEIAFYDALRHIDITASVRTDEGNTGNATRPQQSGSGSGSAESQQRSAAMATPTASGDALSEAVAPSSSTTGAGIGAAAALAQASGLAIEARGTYQGAPLVGRLHASGLLPLAAAGVEAPPVPVQLDLRLGKSRVRLDGSARDVLHLSALEAKFQLEGPSLAALGDAVGATLPTTAPFDMRGAVEKDADVWAIDVASLSVGSSRLRGSFHYDASTDVPVLRGELSGPLLVLTDLAPSLGARPPQRAKPKSARTEGDRLLPQRDFDLPSLGAMNADVKLSLQSADFGTDELEKFAPLSARLRLQDRVLRIDELLARTSGGELRGALALDARDAKAPAWSAELRWSGVQMERFVKARNPGSSEAPRTAGAAKASRGAKQATRAAAQGQPGYVSGVLGGSAKLQGRGRSVAAMLASLDGSVQMWVRDGRVSHLLLELSGIDLAESLGLLVGGDKTLPVSCAVARFNLKNGLAQPEVAVIDTDDTTLLVTGQLSLAREELDLTINARPKDMSLVALRSPVRLRGSFGKPRVSLDKGRIGLRVAAAAALAAVAPLAGLLALVDLGETERSVCGDALARLKGAPAPAAGAVSAVKKPP